MKRPNNLSASHEGHLRCHDGDELDVGLQRQIGHVNHGVGHFVGLHHGLDSDVTPCLLDTFGHARRHFGNGIPDVDLAYRDVVLPSVQRERLGKASDVSGTRHVTSFTRKARPNMPDAVTADLEWKISNTSSRAETITIYENMPSDWVVNAENHKHVLVQPGLIRWDIDVPANQEVTVSWSVSSIN